MPDIAVVEPSAPPGRGPVRTVVQIVFLCVAAAGLVVLLLPRPAGSTVPSGHHHGGTPLPVQPSDDPAASAPSLRLGFDPVALTRELQAAVRRDLDRRIGPGATVRDAQLLYRGSSRSGTTAGITACVVPAQSSAAREWTFDLRLEGNAWHVLRRSAAATGGC